MRIGPETKMVSAYAHCQGQLLSGDVYVTTITTTTLYRLYDVCNMTQCLATGAN